MSESAAKPKKQYFSQYDHGLDEKRRVQIPFRWRPDEENTELTLVRWEEHQAGVCIRVFPPEEFARVLALVQGLTDPDNKAVLMRAVGSESVPVTLDKAGRIILPDTLTKAAGIQREAKLIGCITCFEIWSPERHAVVQQSDAELKRKAFKALV